jgi:hypothetical protein
MHDIHVHQSELVVKPIWTAFSYDEFHMNMGAVFDTGGEMGSGGGGDRVVFGLPVDTEMWVGSRRAIASAGESGEVLSKSTQCWVLETLPLVSTQQTTTVICEYETTNNVRKVVVRLTKENRL